MIWDPPHSVSPSAQLTAESTLFLRLKPPTRQRYYFLICNIQNNPTNVDNFRKIIQTEEQIGYQRNSESPEAQIYDNENYSVSDGEVDGDDDYFNWT